MEYALALISFAIATSGTPGPNTLMVAASAAQLGIRRVMPHMLGITLGFPAMIVAVALGLGLPFAQIPGLHRAMQVVGGAWLLWLAWKIAAAPAPRDQGADGAAPAAPLGFWGAAAFQWVNPKAWMIALAALPAFTVPGLPILPQALLIAGVFALVSMPSLLFWAWIGRAARHLLGEGARLRAFNIGMALLLVLSLLPLVL
ncbi:LysE family translocator [Sediminicoccus sp. KRV36]|uniref:LysE family translocator n=1 Tax=Sediminicoccus sp. KRV36 TaxID=3133721 RepID=UPI00200CE032|nr:LysE family translocator [Sediminicoccus rosea]UPY37775.1 LysE family translocator [Sediminicoccus rosea]